MKKFLFFGNRRVQKLITERQCDYVSSESLRKFFSLYDSSIFASGQTFLIFTDKLDAPYSIFFISDDFYKTCMYIFNNKGISFHFLYPIKKLLQVQTFSHGFSSLVQHFCVCVCVHVYKVLLDVFTFLRILLVAGLRQNLSFLLVN